MNNAYQLIETPSALENAAEKLANEKVIAVDLESDSMYHFKEKICLMQISAKSSTVIIDPLKIEDLSPLQLIFANPEIRKVFHGADYDIRSLFRDYEFEVNNLFDTHLACRFLGYQETGLDALLNKLFNVSLDKKFQKKDWSRRPLSEEMIDYAAGDTRYLLPLARIFEKELKLRRRLSWVREECLLQSRVRPTNNHHEPLYLNFKGAGSLPPRDLAVLEAILTLRKTIAEKKDRPLFKIFQNSDIVKMVQARPSSLKRLLKIKALSFKQYEMYGEQVIDAIKAAEQIPKEELPRYPKLRSPKLRIKEQERIRVLKTWKDQKADELGIEPALVLNKLLISAIAVADPWIEEDLTRIKEMKNWQIQEFGEEILLLLKQMRQETT